MNLTKDNLSPADNESREQAMDVRSAKNMRKCVQKRRGAAAEDEMATRAALFTSSLFSHSPITPRRKARPLEEDLSRPSRSHIRVRVIQKTSFHETTTVKSELSPCFDLSSIAEHRTPDKPSAAAAWLCGGSGDDPDLMDTEVLPSCDPTAVLSSPECVPAPVVPQERDSSPASVLPMEVEPVEYKSPPQFGNPERLSELDHSEPHVPHSINPSQRQFNNYEQPRDDNPFRPLVKEMEIPDEAMYICAQQVRAMLQPYCQCDHTSSPASFTSRNLNTMAGDLEEDMDDLASSRRETQCNRHETSMMDKMERDELIEPEFSSKTPPQWPRPYYRDYSESGELKVQSLLTGAYSGAYSGALLSVQRAELSWRRRAPDNSEIKIERHYDIDTIHMELASLKAITKPTNLCLAPCFTSVISPHYILSDDVKPHRHKNTPLLEFDHGYVHLVFPRLKVDPNSNASNAFTNDEQRQLVDEYILPALRRVLHGMVMQEWPQSFDIAATRASIPQAKQHAINNGIDSASARQKTTLLCPMKSDWLEPFWEEFKHQIERPGCPFNGAKLLFRKHNLKNVTYSQDPAEVVTSLRELLASFDWNCILHDRCWVSFGLRDQVTLPKSRQRTTLLYRADCLAHLDQSGCDDRPWVGFTPQRSTQYLMRDVGSMEEVREDDDARAAPGSHKYIRQFQAYNSHRIAMFSPENDYSLFSQESFRRLLVDDQLDIQLSHASPHSRSHINHEGYSATFESVIDSWNNDIRTVYKQLTDETVQDFGVRREISINLHILLALLDKDIVRKSCTPIRSLELPDGNGHSPFFAVSTSALNDFLLFNSGRFIAAIHHLAICMRPMGGVQNLVAAPNHTQQLSMMRLNRVLVDLLIYSLSSVNYAKEPWLFFGQWLASSPNCADSASRIEQGLNIERIMEERGMVFLPKFAVELLLPSSRPAADANIAWPCNFSEQRAKPQVEPQTGPLVISKSGEVASNALVPESISGLYERLTEHELQANNGISQGTISSTEMEQPVSLCNRYLLPALVDTVDKDSHPTCGSSSVEHALNTSVPGSGTAGAPADLGHVDGSLAHSPAVIVEPSEHVSDVLASSQTAAQPRPTVPPSYQHTPPEADSNNSHANLVRQGRQDETTDLFNNVAAHEQETQTGNKPDEDGTELTNDQPKYRGSFNSRLDKLKDPNIRNMLSRFPRKNNLARAVDLNVSNKGQEG